MWLSLTFASERRGHLSPLAGSSQTRLVNAGLMYRAQRYLLFFAPVSDTSSLTGRESPSYRESERERERERNGSCHFSSFNWDFAALSVTEPLRGRHQTMEKTFHISLSFTTESSYLFSPSVYLLFLWTSHIFTPFILPLFSIACSSCVL